MTINRRALESVLKKCPNITKFGSYESLRLETEVLSMIGQYCPRLKSLYYPTNHNKDLQFFRDYGHKLEELIIENEDQDITHFLEFCPNLKKFSFSEFSVLFTEDKQFLPELQHIYSYITIDKQNVNEIKILSDKYRQTVKTLNCKVL